MPNASFLDRLRSAEDAALQPIVDAELDGIEAFIGGRIEGENPHTGGSKLHAAWQRSWEEARCLMG